MRGPQWCTTQKWALPSDHRQSITEEGHDTTKVCTELSVTTGRVLSEREREGSRVSDPISRDRGCVGMRKGTSRWQRGWAPGRKEWQEESLISEVEQGVHSRKWLLFGVTRVCFREKMV